MDRIWAAWRCPYRRIFWISSQAPAGAASCGSPRALRNILRGHDVPDDFVVNLGQLALGLYGVPGRPDDFGTKNQ